MLPGGMMESSWKAIASVSKNVCWSIMGRGEEDAGNVGSVITSNVPRNKQQQWWWKRWWPGDDDDEVRRNVASIESYTVGEVSMIETVSCARRRVSMRVVCSLYY